MPDRLQLFNKEEELAEVYVAEHYLPIRTMNTFLVLVTVEDEDLFPVDDEDEDSADD